MQKTNALRILDKCGIEYKTYYKELNEAVDGVTLAGIFNLDVSSTYKTLVTVGKSKNHYVFMIPVAESLDLKKAASIVDEKSVEMIPSKELLPTVGYVHGGCSPIGMKKKLVTVIQTGFDRFDKIVFSGAKIGLLVEINSNDLGRILDYKIGDVIRNE